MKILLTVLTCNRSYYAKNCINSIIDFVDLDRVNVLVCDNNTIEEGFDAYLHDISSAHKSIEIKKFEDRIKNELYRAMNYGVQYAMKNDIDVISFIQDDYQYLYKLDQHLDDVANVFDNHKKLIQINYNLVWERKKNKIGDLQYFSHIFNYATLLDKPPCDNGYTRVSVYDKVGGYPSKAISWEGGNMHRLQRRYVDTMNGELWFGAECRKRGWKRAICLHPCQTMIFDCAYVRGNKRFGNYFAPPNKYYIKPFSEEKIDIIRRKNAKKRFSFIERMCEPWGWEPETKGKHSVSEKVVNFG